ncbi:hypothetical protein FXO38_02688 [Capsicum annuum]|nr:hypothetical protein FXO37_20881 [Capsicum annuum]KAF3679576.1 hypothetical protein FXO38_02688 [Capsicum annuum]
MNRLRKKEIEVSKWKEDFSPKCMELFTAKKKIAQFCTVNFNGDTVYEVSESEDRHIVNLVDKKYTCRSWQLTRIPCPHAIKAIEYNKMKPDLMKKEICVWYSKEAYLNTYKVKLLPVREEEEEEEEEVQDDVYDINSSAPQPTQEREDQWYEPFGPASESESDPDLRPKIVPKATRLVVRQTLKISATSGSRLIGFRGDFAGVSEPTDLPYSPFKLTWKGKKAITSNHLENAREMKLGKLKAKKANGRTQI